MYGIGRKLVCVMLIIAVHGNGDVGRCNAIAVDSRGNPWIIYRDDTNNVVKVAHWMPE
jgi:hypothetical protein